MIRTTPILLALSLAVVPFTFGAAGAQTSDDSVLPYTYAATGGGEGWKCSRYPTELEPGDCTRQRVTAKVTVSPDADCRPEFDPAGPVPDEPTFTCTITFTLTVTVEGKGCGYAHTEPTASIIGCTVFGTPFVSYPGQSGTRTYTGVPLGPQPHPDETLTICPDHPVLLVPCGSFPVKVQTLITQKNASQIDPWQLVDQVNDLMNNLIARPPV